MNCLMLSNLVKRSISLTGGLRYNSTVVIVSAVRTPIGSFRGILSGQKTTQLGTVAMKHSLAQANLKPSDVDEVIMGNALQTGAGQSPTRQAAVNAGFPYSVDCTTVNKACASSLKAVTMGAEAISCGQHKIVLAGGMESMSNAPFFILRTEPTYGGSVIHDTLMHDGFLCPFYALHMGACTEQLATKYNINREEQDIYAKNSYIRATDAWKNGYFLSEIAPVEVKNKKSGETEVIKEDQEYKNYKPEKMNKLKSVFIKDGTITAANASKLNDGASAVVLCSAEEASERKLKPLAEILSFSDGATEPVLFGIAPAFAMKKALEKLNMKVEDVDLFEVNEAFSAVPLAVAKELNINLDKLNIHGGAVSLGHPVGASGARILAHLVHSLKPTQIGVAGICNGGGGSTAIVVKKL